MLSSLNIQEIAATNPALDAEKLQGLRVGRRHLVRQRRQKLHIADQVGQTELHRHIEVPHILPIRPEVITPQNPRKLLAQYVNQNLRSP